MFSRRQYLYHEAHHCQGRCLDCLSSMREPGMTFSELLEGMIEHKKKRRLVVDIKRIQETEGLVGILF